MNFTQFVELKSDNLILKKISEKDRDFIEELFSDEEVKKYYLIPKEAQQDYRNLISYWLTDILNLAGYAWIVNQKVDNSLLSDKPCGFIAFEFRDSLKNARISYALKPENRKQGIITRSIGLIINELRSLGVEIIEADIDKDNTNSEKLIEKLGFTTNKRFALIDPEMMRDGEIRARYLWRKELYDYTELKFYVIKSHDFNKLINSRTAFKIWEQEVLDGPNRGYIWAQFNQMKKTGKYHFLFETNVTEKLAGLSNDDITIYYIPWELLREEEHKGKRFLIFQGWGDPMTGGGHFQFNFHEIGIEKFLFANLLINLMSNDPEFFSIYKIKNVIGLEGFRFENGQIKF